jgi:hypothetical protein
MALDSSCGGHHPILSKLSVQFIVTATFPVCLSHFEALDTTSAVGQKHGPLETSVHSPKQVLVPVLPPFLSAASIGRQHRPPSF